MQRTTLSLSFCSDIMWLQHWPSAKPVPCSEHICSVLLSVLQYLHSQYFRNATPCLTYIKMFSSWSNIKGFSLHDAVGGGTRVGELAFTCSQRRSLKTLCKWSAALSRGLEKLVAARIIQKSTVLLNPKVYQPVHRNPPLVRIIRAVHSEPNLAFLRSVLILSNSPFIFFLTSLTCMHLPSRICVLHELLILLFIKYGRKYRNWCACFVLACCVWR